MSPDFGLADAAGMKPRRRGYIDLFINGSHHIGIELTRDGEGLGARTTARAKESAPYAPLKLDAWLVVDFRRAPPSTTKGTRGTVFVVLSGDSRAATIMQEGCTHERVALLE